MPLWRAACWSTSSARYSSGCAAIRRRAADSRDLASQASRPGREPYAELATLAFGYGRPRACGPARPDPGGGGDRTPSPAPADGACSRQRAGRWGERRRRSLPDAHGSRGNACLRLERRQAGCYDQAASRGALPRGCGAPGRAESAPVAASQDGRGRHGGERLLADLLTGRAVTAAHAVGSSGTRDTQNACSGGTKRDQAGRERHRCPG